MLRNLRHRLKHCSNIIARTLILSHTVREATRLLLRKESREELSVKNPQSLAALIRIYAHAIEKSCYSISFQPGRGIRKALTLRNLLELPLCEKVDQNTITWARRMLDLYDRRAHTNNFTPPYEPHVGLSAEQCRSFFDFVKMRRSVRCFLPRLVEKNIFLSAVEVMRYAPTSCNRQAVKLFATIDPKVAGVAHSLCLGHSGFDSIIPAFGAFCVDTYAYAMPHEYPLIFVDGAICAAFFVLGCQAVGLGATLMAWTFGRFDEEMRLRSLLRIPEQYEIVLACAFGHPANRWPSVARKPIEEWISISANDHS